MAITKVQGEFHGFAAGANLTVNFGSTPTAGNLLIALAFGTTAVVNASISGWTLATSAVAAGVNAVALFYRVAGVSEPTGVPVVWTSSVNTHMAIEEWDTVSVLDQIAHTDSTGSAVTSRSSGTTPTTTASAALLIAGFAMGNNVTVPSFTNSFATEVAFPTGSIVAVLGSLVVSATGAYETTLSWTTSRLAGGLIATFKAAAAGGAKPWHYYSQMRGV